MDVIKVMIVDDDQSWREHMRELLVEEKDIQVIHSCADEAAALQALQNQVPDIVLLDIMLSKHQYNGIEAAGRIHRLSSSKIIMLTSLSADKQRILQAFDQGVVNYIGKESYRDIPGAIRAAYKGRVSIHPDCSAIVTQELRRERKLRVLSPAERSVQDLREEGKTRKQIAEYLVTTADNVKRHIYNIRKKLEREGGK
ncbi:response regulator transcription factor [Paenibacillus sedimenti]|uniref:Response regulator transcription factor n=1 Tax=Paenibacillus sedimenti TaxID=2770274 RepID=A0A926QIG9_9BACL|nr:response regulator transcription factor [Paenibacillus sedimenti]MBD0379603.1 response regulator transcription factor [Paenibacillus sedimenti]